MANRKNVHVVPRNAGWAVIREGAKRASEVTGRQADAIAAARSLAQAGAG